MNKTKFNKMKKALISSGFSEDDIVQFTKYSPSKKLKTIEQWLQENLTPEQFENAKMFKFADVDWEEETDSLSQAIHNGFKWSLVPEGYEYWRKKYYDLKSKDL